MHALAFILSAGHGAFLLLHIKKPLNKIKIPEIKNSASLYLDIIIKNGKLDNRPAKIAPAPKATNSAGNAQQRRVPKLVKRLKEGNMRLLSEIGLIRCFSLFFQLHNQHLQIIYTPRQ